MATRVVTVTSLADVQANDRIIRSISYADGRIEATVERPAPEVEPGTVGTATVRVGDETIAENEPGVWVEFDFPDHGRYLSFVLIHGGAIAKAEHVHDFTPAAPDTAALRAQLDDANRALNELTPIVADLDDDTVHDGSMADVLRSGIARLRAEVAMHEALAAVRPSNAQYAEKIREQAARADAAEARLARLTEDNIADTIIERTSNGGGPHDAALAILALVAVGEQAAQGEAATVTREQVAEAIRGEAGDAREFLLAYGVTGDRIIVSSDVYCINLPEAAHRLHALLTGGQS